MGLFRDLADAFTGRAMTIVNEPHTPPPIRRDFVIDPASRVRVGDVALERILKGHPGDPLGLGVDEEWLTTRDRERARTLAIAVLTGALAVPPTCFRAELDPITGAMLRAAGIDPDGFAALAAVHSSGGLYIEDDTGVTLAKAVDTNMGRRPLRKVHVRVRVRPWHQGGPATYWQSLEDDCQMAVPALPATISAALIGRRLGDVMSLDDPEAERFVVIGVNERRDLERISPASIIVVRPPD